MDKKEEKYLKAKQVIEDYEKVEELKKTSKERQSLIDSLKDDKLYTVRLYDYFDHYWIDVLSSVSKKEAIESWDKHTKNGTQNTKYEHRDYYAIFPADTRMLRS